MSYVLIRDNRTTLDSKAIGAYNVYDAPLAQLVEQLTLNQQTVLVKEMPLSFNSGVSYFNIFNNQIDYVNTDMTADSQSCKSGGNAIVSPIRQKSNIYLLCNWSWEGSQQGCCLSFLN